MKKVVYFVLFVVCGCACNERSTIQEKLLDPRVRTAQEFVEHLKKDERFYALTLINSYNPDSKDDLKLSIDSLYKSVYDYTSKYKLAPTNKWAIDFDTLYSTSGDYSICFQDVFVPFDGKPQGHEPSLLRISFDTRKSVDEIFDFEVILCDMIDGDTHEMKVHRRLSAKQDKLLK